MSTDQTPPPPSESQATPVSAEELALVLEVRCASSDTAAAKLIVAHVAASNAAALARVAAADKEIERLKGEWHFQRHDADQLRSALTAARQELAQKENDIQWVETRISCDDSGAELLKERAAHEATKKALAVQNEKLSSTISNVQWAGEIITGPGEKTAYDDMTSICDALRTVIEAHIATPPGTPRTGEGEEKP